MAGRGETVKYVIDADVSAFIRGLLEADAAAKASGKSIDRSLSRTATRSENNFQDIRRSAATAASSIRNFGVTMQAFNTTSAIVGVTALTGAILELSGAVAAAGSTLSILPAILMQGVAAVTTYKTGVFGLGEAWKAIQNNNGEAFLESMRNLGPAATEVAYAMGGLNKAFNGVRLNTQNALLDGLADQMLRLGAVVMPTLNAGMQRVAQSMNGMFKEAIALGQSPLFGSLLATVFADTAQNVSTLTGALSPLLSAITNLYIVTRPYVAMLSEQFVNMTKNFAAYMGSARGQMSLTVAILQGITALKQLGGLISAVFGLLLSVFRTASESGGSLILTLTSIIRSMQAWVNSAEGQAKLTALFRFTALTVQAVATAVGNALQFFFGMIQAVDSLNPGVQRLVVNFLATGMVLRPLLAYMGQLYLAIRVVAVTLFNVAQQAKVMFMALGGLASVVLIAATALIFLGNIIGGPLGAIFMIVGGIIASYIVLNYLLGIVAATTAPAVAATGAAGVAAGTGLTVAARGAVILQAALLPLLILAAGVLLILSMLGVFSSKAKGATGATTGLGNSLGALQKSMKNVGTTGGKASNGGLSALNDSLGQVGESAEKAQGSLAGFDKMNVLTDPSGGAGGIGSGIPNLPSLPDIGSPELGAPTLNTDAFNGALDDMLKNFEGLEKKLKNPLSNPFDALGKWIDKHPWIALAGFAVVLGIIIALFVTGAVAIGFTVLAVSLLVLAIIAIIAIIIILWKNWDTIWAAIKDAAAVAWQFLQGVWDGILNGAKAMVTAVGDFFVALWDGIKAVWGVVTEWFGTLFTNAWNGIKLIWGVVIAFFQGVWDGIMLVFSVIGTWFGDVFTGAWNAVKTAWGAVSSFFQGIWNGVMGVFSGIAGWFGGVFQDAWNRVTGIFSGLWNWFRDNVWNKIVGIFGGIGSSIGDAISGAFKGVINTALNFVTNFVNGVIKAINGAIGLINKIPGVNVKTINTITLPRLAKGGLITSPTIAQIGENGAEAVMPLENNTGWIDKLAEKINASNGGGNNQPLNVTLELDGTKLGQIIIDRINEKTQMSGRNTILV